MASRLDRNSFFLPLLFVATFLPSAWFCSIYLPIGAADAATRVPFLSLSPFCLLCFQPWPPMVAVVAVLRVSKPYPISFYARGRVMPQLGAANAQPGRWPSSIVGRCPGPLPSLSLLAFLFQSFLVCFENRDKGPKPSPFSIETGFSTPLLFFSFLCVPTC